MARTTHDRTLDHRGADLDSNIELDGATTNYADGDGLHTVISDIDDRIDAAGGGGMEELLTGDDSIFTSTVGNWTASAGTLTRNTTGYKIGALVASLKWVSSASAQYIEVPVAGTFVAGEEYHAVLAVTAEETGQCDFSMKFGLIGTDEATVSFAQGIGDGNYAFYLIKWIPTANRTGVKLRLVRNFSSGTKTYRVGYARVVKRNGTVGLAIISDNRLVASGIGASSITPLMYDALGRAAAYVTPAEPSRASYNNVPAVAIRENAIILSGGGDNQDAYLYMNNLGYMSLSGGGTTASDLSQNGINIEIAPDYVGLYIDEKDAGTIQIYADSSGGYDIELVDRGAGFWKIRNEADTLSTNLANLHSVLIGTADPTAGGGVAHPMPAMYLRNNSGTTELWLATGTGATAWTKQNSP